MSSKIDRAQLVLWTVNGVFLIRVACEYNSLRLPESL